MSKKKTTYYQPNVNQNAHTEQPLSVFKWIMTIILSSIPVINIICWIVWLVGPNQNKGRKNYLKAQIILYIIVVVVCSGLVASFGGISTIGDAVQSSGII